jgi:hypothetical protein
VTGKVEYLHLDFGNQSTLVANPNNTVPVAVTFNSRLKDDIVRLGLNYKFDPNLIYAPATDMRNISKGLADARVLKRTGANVPWSWTGYYLGLNAGYSWGNTKTDAFFSDEIMGGLLYTSSPSSHIGGKLGGAQTGFNWQLGSWIWGVEADAQFADQRGTLLNPLPRPDLQRGGNQACDCPVRSVPEDRMVCDLARQVWGGADALYATLRDGWRSGGRDPGVGQRLWLI